METCDCLSGEGLISCYAQFGCDVTRVRAFYGPVAALEKQWEAAGGGEEAAASSSTSSLRGAPAGTTLDEDEYFVEGGQGSSGSDGSPAPWWPLGLPPLWS